MRNHFWLSLRSSRRLRDEASRSFSSCRPIATDVGRPTSEDVSVVVPVGDGKVLVDLGNVEATVKPRARGYGLRYVFYVDGLCDDDSRWRSSSYYGNKDIFDTLLSLNFCMYKKAAKGIFFIKSKGHTYDRSISLELYPHRLLCD